MIHYLKIGGLLLLLVVLAWYRNSVFNDGIEHCKNEARKAAVIQHKEYERKLKEQSAIDLKKALETAKAQQKVIIQTQEVIRYVDREIKVPSGCDDLANDVISVLKQASDITQF